MELNNTYRYFDALNELILIISTDMTIEYANKTTIDFSGLTYDEIIGTPVYELPIWQYSSSQETELMFVFGHVFSTEMPRRLDIFALNRHNKTEEIDLHIEPIIEDGVVVKLLARGFNISDLINTRGYLTRRERQIDAFFEHSTQGYFFQILPEAAFLPEELDDDSINHIYDAQRLEAINNNVYNYLGISPQLDTNDIDIMKALNIDEEKRMKIWREMLTCGFSDTKSEVVNRKTGDRVILDLKFVGIITSDNKFEGNFCIVSNITQQFIYEKELSFLANKDPLTGLNNRRNFFRLANDLLSTEETEFSVMMLDIDRFKSINDNYGHDVGDIVIRKVADIIENNIDATGVVGRYGGEEFIVLLNMNDIGAVAVADKIRKTIETSNISYGSGTVRVTISIGIHEFNESQIEVFDNAIKYADIALLEAKKTGRNRIVLYDDELHGMRAVDKITGTFNKNALLYKNKQFQDNLRKSDIVYGVVVIRLNTLIVHQLEILSQYVKQTATMLNDILRERDIVGRYDDMTFVVLLSSVNHHVVRNVKKRVESSLEKLNEKFDYLVTTTVKEMTVDDWSMHIDDIYETIFDEIENPKIDIDIN